MSANHGQAALEILKTEMVRTVLLDGTIEFLLRGSDPAQVSATDIRYFRVNADGDYLDEGDLPEIFPSHSFHVVITDDMDT